MKESKHDNYLNNLADNHSKRLIQALIALEDRIVALASTAPVQDGELFDLEWAIIARTQVAQAAQAELLTEVDQLIREYRQVYDETFAMVSEYGAFTQLPQEVITQLQRMAFQGFEEIANTYIDTMADQMYQYTLTGRTPADMTKALRGVINGVYQQADEQEIAALVETANFGSEKAAKEAIEKLHSIYGSDKLGNNLRRYANVYIQDSIMQFNAQAVVALGREIGTERWKYYGDTINDSREFCREHAGKTYTTEEIYKIWEGDWKGKSSGDPFIVRGGYNCRHHFRPLAD